jgi:hypothetical protein
MLLSDTASARQPSASVRTAAATTAELTTNVNILPGWPAGSPDPNHAKNLWAILESRVEELGPGPKGELINMKLDKISKHE